MIVYLLKIMLDILCATLNTEINIDGRCGDDRYRGGTGK